MKLMGEDSRVKIEGLREATRRGACRRAMAKHLSPISLALAAVLVVGACGSSAMDGDAAKQRSVATTQAARPTNATNPSVASRTMIPESALREMRAALDAWASFPINASVRPLVLTSDPVSAPTSGFRTVDAKDAFLTGLFIAPDAIPSGPQQAEGFPVISAAQALAAMRAEGTAAGGAPHPPTPLVITSVRFGTSSFATDRGTQLLPAWLFSFPGVENTATVLAVAPSSIFPAPPASLHRQSVGARLAADGRTATITFVGTATGDGPCTADYDVDQLASKTAVSVRVREVRETRRSGVICTAVGYSRQETIVLDTPLGNRVLVDASTKGPVAIAP